MAPPTRSRGPSDTLAPLLALLRRPRFERAFVLALSVALLLHLPLLPLRVFDLMRIALFGSAADYDDKDAEAIVPIDLDILAKDLVPDPPPTPAPPPPAPPTPNSEGPADGGAPHEKTPPRPHDAPDAGPRPLLDPTSAAGGAGKIAAKDPNVQVLISGEVLRKHEIGAWGSGSS